MKRNRKIAPLEWVKHHIRDNGWYGYTISGAQIVYVYPPTHFGRRARYWSVYQYWGANHDRCKNFGRITDPRTGKPNEFKSPRKAKLFAQRYWKAEVEKLFV